MGLFGDPAWNANAMVDQTGRTVMITGATSGLGLSAARALDDAVETLTGVRLEA